MQLTQRVAVVTGAAGGLGSAIARRFAREGARLVLCDINEAAVRELADEMTASGAECLGARCDVSSSASVAEMFAAADARFGTVHILVNNAASAKSSTRPAAPSSEDAMPVKDFAGKTVFVTGPGSGLGIVTRRVASFCQVDVTNRQLATRATPDNPSPQQDRHDTERRDQ